MADGDLVPIAVDGLRGRRFILGTEEDLLDEVIRPGTIEPQVTFLAPLDPFVWDRDLLRSLFDFDYVWEVYVPEHKRRWGYYVLPILFGDRLVGRIEPRIDRASGTLRVLGLWWEEWFDPRARGRVRARHPCRAGRLPPVRGRQDHRLGRAPGCRPQTHRDTSARLMRPVTVA